MITLYALAAAVGIGVLWLGTNIKVVKQFERGVVFRFGRVQSGLRGPGLTMLIPIADRLEKVNMQIITMAVPAQDGITRDNVTVRVDAVIYFKVSDPVRAAVDVQDYVSAIGQVAQTSLRSIIGKSNLDDLLSNRTHRIRDLEIDDSIHPDGHIVAGDAILGGHGHRDDLHVHFFEAIGDRNQHRESGCGGRIAHGRTGTRRRVRTA